MKTIKALTALACIAALGFSLTACDNNDEDQPVVSIVGGTARAYLYVSPSLLDYFDVTSTYSVGNGAVKESEMSDDVQEVTIGSTPYEMYSFTAEGSSTTAPFTLTMKNVFALKEGVTLPEKIDIEVAKNAAVDIHYSNGGKDSYVADITGQTMGDYYASSIDRLTELLNTGYGTITVTVGQ